MWSPDGKWIAFVADRNIPKSHACRYDDDVACPTEIYIVRPNGTGERRITPSSVGTHTPAWSPDASKLAFHMNSRLYVINLDGSGLRPLTKSKFRYESSPSWSPDGKEMAFVGNDDIYVIGLNGRQRRLTNSKRGAKADPTDRPHGHRTAARSLTRVTSPTVQGSRASASLTPLGRSIAS